MAVPCQASPDPEAPKSTREREPLLEAKRMVPPIRSLCVPRPRLEDRMHAGLDKALILVSAPAGYGKTTLVSTWLHQVGIPSAWLSLDDEDNDPVRFLQYFISSLQKTIPSVQGELLNLIKGREPPSYLGLMDLLVQKLTGQTAPAVIVLDDFHLITNDTILEMLAFFIDHLPPQVHVVLLTRTDPPLRLSRLRASHQLLEVRAEHLRFTTGEIHSFLSDVMGLDLSSDDITAIENRTEGWIASIQLAALSMQGRPDIHGFVTAFTGSHAYIMDYLVEEVLRLQPDTVRTFLLKASILSSMCAPLCEAVVEIGEQRTENHQSFDTRISALRSRFSSSEAILDYLDRSNLFLIPLDDRREWYRFHHLFRDVLNRHLEQGFPQLIPELHRQASSWYEQNGYIPEAIQHALKARDQDRAAQLVEHYGCQLIMNGEVITLSKSMEAFEAQSQTRPWMAMLKAWVLILSKRLDQVDRALQVADMLVDRMELTDEARILKGSITSARAYYANLQGDFQNAADYARQALGFLPSSTPFSCGLRSVTTSTLGFASWLQGDLEEALSAYSDAVQIGQAAGNTNMVTVARSDMGQILIEQGRLREAANLFAEIISSAARPDGQLTPFLDDVYAGLSQVAYELNDLEAAARYTNQCIELCRRWGNTDCLAVATWQLARLELARQNTEPAQEAVHALDQMKHQDRLSPRRAEWLRPAMARLMLAQGEVERAAHLLQQGHLTGGSGLADEEIPYHKEFEYTTLLKVLIAQGSYEAALAVSERLLSNTSAADRTGIVIEGSILRALAWQGMRDLPHALADLDQAIRLAEPAGYVRLFLDEGEPMAKLLYQARSHSACAGYAAGLLARMGEAFGKELPPSQLLIEPLTAREVEVLRLIQSGLSNQEIAGRLFISVPTVKCHITHIYGKLGVTSRTQAVLRGKEVGLIE